MMMQKTGSLQLSENQLENMKFLLAMLVLACVASSLAYAGTDTTFEDWTEQAEAWLQGSFGKGISLAMIIVGAVTSVVQKNLMYFAVGIGTALGLNYIVGILDSMFTAVI